MTSVQWKGILQDGTFAVPGTADTLKFDASDANGSGTAILSTSITNRTVGDTGECAYNHFQALAAKEGVAVPVLLQLLGIMPPAGEIGYDEFSARNNGERLALRGGSFNGCQGLAGVFALNLRCPRTVSLPDFGFRSAFVNL